MGCLRDKFGHNSLDIIDSSRFHSQRKKYFINYSRHFRQLNNKSNDFNLNYILIKNHDFFVILIH